MADRGEYRAIQRVLLDERAYQRLSERARHVLLVCKLTLGPTGLQVCYPTELVARLHRHTAIPECEIAGVLDELEAGAWLRREDPLVWVVNQLADEPLLKAADRKHRLSVQRHLTGLPRVALLRAFVERYPEWFADAPDLVAALAREFSSQGPSLALRRGNEGPSEGLGSASEGPSEGQRSTENKSEDKTENDLKAAGAAPAVVTELEEGSSSKRSSRARKSRAPGEPAPWMGELRRVHRERYDADPPAQLAKLYRPLVHEHGAPEVVRRYANMLTSFRPGFYSPAPLVAAWADFAEPPAPTARGDMPGAATSRDLEAEAEAARRLAIIREHGLLTSAGILSAERVRQLEAAGQIRSAAGWMAFQACLDRETCLGPEPWGLRHVSDVLRGLSPRGDQDLPQVLFCLAMRRGLFRRYYDHDQQRAALDAAAADPAVPESLRERVRAALDRLDFAALGRERGGFVVATIRRVLAGASAARETAVA